MTIEMSQDAEGVWTYHDPFQAELVITVLLLTSWKMTTFDAWLNESSNFTDFPVIHKNMMLLRDRFTDDCRHAWKQDDLLRALASDLRHTWYLAELLMEKRAYEKKQALRRTGKGKLSEAQKKELAVDLKMADSTYGQIKRLAAKYGVSTRTIRRALNKP
jgi:hypothetical protein